MLVYIDGYYGVTITTTDVIDIADTCIEMHQTPCVYTRVNRCSILLSVPHVAQIEWNHSNPDTHMPIG